ncbi:MAG: hypothetical protein ACHQD8_05620 [Chitinophagales bacterium]
MITFMAAIALFIQPIHKRENWKLLCKMGVISNTGKNIGSTDGTDNNI